MRHTLLLTAALGTILLLGSGASRADDLILAQASGTNLGTPQTQPQPGGGVSAGPGAPTSASPSAGPTAGRGAPSPGSGTATPGGDASSSTLTPGGAIRPGTASPGGTGGSSSN